MCRYCRETNTEAHTISKSCDLAPVAGKENANAPVEKIAAVLPCSIDLLSLIEVLDTPKEHVAIITMVDDTEPNSTTKWRESASKSACIQMMFTDTRYSAKRMLDDVHIMMLVNHSTNYNILPVRTQPVDANGFAHFCCCGSIACHGSTWRKKFVKETRQTMIPAAHVIKENLTAFAPPNVCPLTFRESLGDGNMYDGVRCELILKSNIPNARKERYQVQLEQQKRDWMVYDQSRRIALVPFSPDDDVASARRPNESLAEYEDRMDELYAALPVCYVPGVKQPVEALAMRYSIASQRTSALLEGQLYDAEALGFIRSKSAHCLPLCYPEIRETLMRFIKCRRPIRSLLNYSAKLRERYHGSQSNDDKEAIDAGCHEHEDWLLSLNQSVMQNDSPYGVDTDLYEQGERTANAKAPPKPESEESILTRLDRRFANAVGKCTGKSDCNCLMDEFIQNQTGSAICLSTTPRPQAPIYQRLGDSIFTADSRLMSEISAYDCYSSVRLASGTKECLTKTKTLDTKDRTQLEEIVNNSMDEQHKLLKEFVFTPDVLLVERELCGAMQRQLGGFSVVKAKDGSVYLKARSDLLQSYHHAFQAFVERVLNRVTNNRVAAIEIPFGDVYCDLIKNRTRQEMLQEAARIFPQVASQCRNLSDYVYALGWHVNRDIFKTVANWLPGYTQKLVNCGLDNPENTVFTFDSLARFARDSQRGILADAVEDVIGQELAVTRNMRMVIARLTAQYCTSIVTLPDFHVAVSKAIMIVGVCKLYSIISDRIREDALKSIAKESEEQLEAQRQQKAEKKLAAEQSRLEQKAKREAARAAHEEKERLEREAREAAEAERRRAKNSIKRQKKELARQQYEAALKEVQKAAKQPVVEQAFAAARQAIRVFSADAPEFKPTLLPTPPPQPIEPVVVVPIAVEPLPASPPTPPIAEKKATEPSLEQWFQQATTFKLYDMWGFSLVQIN